MYRLTVALPVVLICCVTSGLRAQSNAVVFHEEDPLTIKLSVSLRSLKKETNDSTFIPALMMVKADGAWDSIPIEIRTRGHFRKENCTYPPLRIKMKKKDTEKTVFQGTKSLKLVVPCHEAQSNQDLINREYLCYKLYEPVSAYRFSTRRADITLIDPAKGNKTTELNGFFIEDDDAASARHNARVVDEKKLNPMHLEDTSSLRLDLFQYMIANTDFSTTFFHNIKIFKTVSGKNIPVPYDFDMAGVVNAPYATVDPKWEIKSVRERVYKGYCRNDKIAEHVRQEYLGREQQIFQIIDHHQQLLGPKETESLKKYLGEFFTILKSDQQYDEKILKKCRSKI